LLVTTLIFFGADVEPVATVRRKDFSIAEFAVVIEAYP